MYLCIHVNHCLSLRTRRRFAMHSMAATRGRRDGKARLNIAFLAARVSRRLSCGPSVNKNTPLEKNTHGEISFKSTKPGAGEQLLLQDCMAKARVKGVVFTDTGIIHMRHLLGWLETRLAQITSNYLN